MVFIGLRSYTFAALLVAGGFACGGLCAAYPERPVRIVVGALGGDTTDLIARITAPSLTETFKQRFAIENYPGANGTLAAARAAKARPDGHTLLFTSASFAANASLYLEAQLSPAARFRSGVAHRRRAQRAPGAGVRIR